MPKATEEGKKPTNGGKKKKIRKQRILRLILVLCAIFLLVSAVAGYATYQVVSAYMEEIPEFDISKFLPSETSFYLDKDGVEIAPLEGAENRTVVSLEEMADHLINAFIAIEDERFFEHSGFDIRGIMRAAFNNTFNRDGGMQGGSTITQQLVKNTFFSLDQYGGRIIPERSLRRKIQELYISLQVERIFTKEEILHHYLNKIFFGHRAYGVEAAAQTYFGKSAAEVTLAEAAMLAGIPNLPNRFNPRANMEAAKRRQALVLNRMEALEMITREEARQARDEEIVLVERRQEDNQPYIFFRNRVREDAHKIVSALPDYSDLSRKEIWHIIYGGGLRIYTTLDREMQNTIDEIIANQSLYPPAVGGIRGHAAVIIVETGTGHIRAMSPGDDYENSDPQHRINRVREPKQAGSVFKPIIAFAPAFNEGIAAPGSVYDDAPTLFEAPGRPVYAPRNFFPRFRGLITLRQAIIESLNLPAIHVLNELGIDTAKEYAERMGVTTLRDPKTGEFFSDDNLAMAAGGLSLGLSVYDAAQAFSVFANEGVRIDMTTIRKITDRSGKVIFEHKPNGEEIISREAAWLMTSTLQDAVTRPGGTARRLRIGRPVAVKTGTSNDARDAWMAAYTPDYVAVLWLGRDSWGGGQTGNFRSWDTTYRFMNPIMLAIHKGLPKREFSRPEGIRSVAVCSKSGLRPGDNCPADHIRTDYFISGHIPSRTCDIHVTLKICTVSGKLAGEFCPPELVETRFFFDRPPFLVTDSRWGNLPAGLRPADASSGAPTVPCDHHTYRPSDVSELSASAKDDGTVTLSWRTASGAFGYFLTRDGKLLTSKAIQDTSFTDKNLKPGSYTYTLQAVNSQGVTSRTVSVSVTVPKKPPEPEPEPEPVTEPVTEPDNNNRNGEEEVNGGNRGRNYRNNE